MEDAKLEESLRAELNGTNAEDDKSEDNHDSKQSEINQNSDTDDNSEVTPVKYAMPDGRELTGEEVLNEYKSLQSEFTRKSQKLSKLEKSNESVEDKDDRESGKNTLTPEEQNLVNELTRLGFAKVDQVEKVFNDKKSSLTSEAASLAVAQTDLRSAISQLTEEFNGSEGKPKVDGNKVLNFIVQYPSTELSPLQIAKALYPDEFVKYEAGKMSGGKMLETEDNSSGAGDHTPPSPKYNFGDGSAEKAVRELLK